MCAAKNTDGLLWSAFFLYEFSLAYKNIQKSDYKNVEEQKVLMLQTDPAKSSESKKSSTSECKYAPN